MGSLSKTPTTSPNYGTGYGSLAGPTTMEGPPVSGVPRSLTGPPTYGAPTAAAPAPAPAPAPTYGAPSSSSWRDPVAAPPPPAWPSAPSTTQIDFPEYQPYAPQEYTDPNLDVLAGYGEGLLDPGSDYYKELIAQMRGDVGASGAAAKRLAALEAAESGFGAGASPEYMSTVGDIDYATQVAMGEGAGALALEAPGLGAEMMASTFSPRLGYGELTEGSRQYGAGLGEEARQFGIQTGLTQQQMAQDLAMTQAGMEQDWEQWQQEFEQREAELAASYGGGYGDVPVGGGSAVGGYGLLG